MFVNTMSRTAGLSAQQTDTLAIEITRLRKSYGEVRALDGIDLRVSAGSVFGVLGPNGAGKTTIVRTLATLVPPDSGEVRVLGHDVVREAGAIRDRIGLTGQYSSVDEELSGRDNLVLLSRLRGFSWSAARRRAEELLATFGLEEAAARLVRISTGFDPRGLGAVDVGHREREPEYVGAAGAFATGTPDGLRSWLRHYMSAVEVGADQITVIGDEILAAS